MAYTQETYLEFGLNLLVSEGKTGLRFLDIGCGRVPRYLVQFSINHPEVHILGIDDRIQPPAKSPSSNLELRRINFFNYSSNEQFDLISALGVWPMLPSGKMGDLFLRKINSMLKPGGVLVITNYEKFGVLGMQSEGSRQQMKQNLKFLLGPIRKMSIREKIQNERMILDKFEALAHNALVKTTDALKLYGFEPIKVISNPSKLPDYFGFFKIEMYGEKMAEKLEKMFKFQEIIVFAIKEGDPSPLVIEQFNLIDYKSYMKLYGRL